MFFNTPILQLGLSSYIIKHIPNYFLSFYNVSKNHSQIVVQISRVVRTLYFAVTVLIISLKHLTINYKKIILVHFKTIK